MSGEVEGGELVLGAPRRLFRPGWDVSREIKMANLGIFVLIITRD